MGKNPSVISRILKGNRQIKASELPAIERYLGSAAAWTGASEDDFHLALGKAIAAWNRLEDSMELLVYPVFDGPQNLMFHDQIHKLYKAIPSFSGRVAIINDLLENSLSQHRIQREAWRSLLQRILAAQRLREQHLRTSAIGEDQFPIDAPDVFYGASYDDGVLTAEKLEEDAILITAIKSDISKFWAEISRLEVRKGKSEPKPP